MSGWLTVNCCASEKNKIETLFIWNIRLQNSPYFCVFKYAPAVNKRSGMRLKTESETGERRFARVRLLRHALPISLLILRKKPTVLQSIGIF